MRNPKKRRDIAAVFAVVGFAASAIALAVNSGKSTSQGAWFGIVVFGFFDFALSMIGFIVCHISYRRQQKLLSGVARLAKWTVSPVDAQQFRVNEKKHIDVKRSNAIKVRKQSDAVGFDVIVSQEAVMVDEDFYLFADRRGLQWLPEVPASLEFNMATATKNGTIRWNIRFPVPASAEPDARVVWDYFNRPIIAPNLLNRYRAMRKFGIICFLVSQVLLLFAFVYFNNVNLHNAALMAGIIGGIGSFAGMFSFVLAQVLLSKSKNGAR